MTSDPLEALYQKLSDGESIDWAHWQQQHPALAEQIGRMARLEAIARFHRGRHKPLDEHSWDTAPAPADVLFEWGHLSVLAAIGEGSFGEVYRAHDPVLNRTVALKLLKKNVSDDLHAQRFIQEARRLAKVRHRHVLAVHGAQIHNGRAGLWADDIDGASLTHRALADAPCSKAFWLKIAGQLCDALTAVHGAGLVHGDVKPANVMLDEHGEVVLMDFGAAAVLDDEAESLNHWTGSPAYLAPEWLQQQRKTPASDVYALGLLFHRLLSGPHAFEQMDWAQRGQALADARAQMPLRRWPGLRRLLAHMVHPDAQQRPSAESVHAELLRIEKAPALRRRKQLSRALIGALAAGLLLAIFAWQHSRTLNQRIGQEKALSDGVNHYLNRLLGSASDLGSARDVRVADLLDAAMREGSELQAQPPLVRAASLYAIGNSYNSLKQAEKAKEDLQRADALIPASAAGDALALRIRLELVVSLHQLDEHAPSRALLQGVLAAAAAHPELHRLARIRLAQSLIAAGEMAEAEAELMQLAQATPDPLSARNNSGFLTLAALANLTFEQSRYAESEQWARQALAWLQRYPQAAEVNLFNTLNRLAMAAGQLGHIEAAEQHYLEALALGGRLYGENHPGTLPVLVNLGNLWQAAGRFEDALEMKQRGADLAEQVHGASHMTTLQAQMNLANALNALERRAQGVPLLTSVRDRAIERFGSEHRFSLLVSYNWIEAMQLDGRAEAVQDAARANWQGMQAQFGPTHLFTAMAQDNWAINRDLTGHYPAAAELWREALDILRAHHAHDRTHIQQLTQHWLSAAQRHGDDAQAQVLREALADAADSTP